MLRIAFSPPGIHSPPAYHSFTSKESKVLQHFLHPRSRVLQALALGAATLALSTSLSASTCIWTGATSGAWSVAGNWSSCMGNAPVNGDTLQFPEAGANKNTSHDLATLTSIAGLEFSGTTSGYVLSGNALSIGAEGIINSNGSGTNTLSLNLTLTAPQSFTGSTGAMQMNSGINLGGQALVISWPSVNALVPWVLNGVISGSGGITVNGAEAADGLYLSANNTFAGPVTLNGGITVLQNADALGVGDGTAANGTSVASVATIEIGLGIDVGNELLTLAAGGGQSNNGQVFHNGPTTWAGPVLLPGSGFSEFTNIQAGSLLNLNGIISGTGGLGLGVVPGTIYQLNNSGNSFSGGIKTFENQFGAIIRLGTDNVIPDASAVDLVGSATLDTNGQDDIIAGLSCTATDKVIMGNGNKLIVGGDNASTTCGAAISDPSADPNTSIEKVGNGTLTLSGSSTFAKEIRVIVGTLAVDGTFPAASSFSAGTGASLFGNGTLGKAFVNGTIHGGSASVPGTLNADQLSVFDIGTLTARISSAAVFDQISAASVNLLSDAPMSGPLLSVTLNFVPAPGSVFTIIDNTGATAVNGTFDSLPEGQTVMANGIGLVISYVGGTGNDITLTAGNAGGAAAISYNPASGSVVTLSAAGTGTIAATGSDFLATTSAAISNCTFSPASAAFPPSAFSVTAPTFAAPNGMIDIACVGQAAAVSGLMDCVQTIDGVATTPRWPISCPVALPAIAPTAALAATTLTLVNGAGTMDVEILTAGTAPGSLDLLCAIDAGSANFLLDTGASRGLLAPAILGASAPAIGLSCTPQLTLQTALLSCAQNASPAPNPADLSANITCPALPAVATAIPSSSPLGRWALLLLMLGLGMALTQRRGH
jgi:autotransporter-associated beta strand protein